MRTLRRDLLVAFIAITGFLCFIPIFTYVVFASSLSSKESLMSHNDAGIQLLDFQNRPFFSFYQTKFKKEIPLSQIPKITQQAIISMEDKDFYSHPGFSVPSIIRSFYENTKGGSITYGASTITQQLIKNSLLTPRKDYFRKIQEIILAQEVDRRYQKDEILEMYLNSAYFGEGSFGIEEAALTYFNKKATDLTLAQSAILVGILPSPSKFSLLNGDLDEAKFRQKLVLEKMVEQNYITPKQMEDALNEDLKITRRPIERNSLAPHFALMVRDKLVEEYGEDTVVRSGFKVKTTINLEWQKFAEASVAKQVEKLKVNRATNGAAVVMDPKTGEIRALVGSKDWYDEKFGKVNIAISNRPPGSAFKPIVYIKALEQNMITLSTILKDEPTSFANFDESKFYASFPTRGAAQAALARDPNAYYKPKNYDGKFRGPVTVRRALSNSLNVPSVAVMKKVGIEGALDSAKNLGITTLNNPENYGLSLVLGAGEVKLLELTEVYSVFANNGYKNEPTLILEITDKMGNIIYKYEPKPEKVVDEKYTFLISSILSDNRSRTEVFGTTLNISRPAAVKTGTTEDFKDAWTMGYTPSLTVGVWVGNNFGETMDGVAGSLGAAPIWKELMEEFLKDTPAEEFIPPNDVIKLAPCGVNTSSKTATGSATTEFFAKGTEPFKNCIPVPRTPLPSTTPGVSPQQSPSTSGPSPTNPPSPTQPQGGPDNPKPDQPNTSSGQGNQNNNNNINNNSSGQGSKKD